MRVKSDSFPIATASGQTSTQASSEPGARPSPPARALPGTLMSGRIAALAGKLKNNPATNKRVKLGSKKFNVKVPWTSNQKTGISFLTTGGTISAEGSEHSYRAGNIGAARLMGKDVKPSNVRVDSSAMFGSGIDSKDMDEKHWLELLDRLSGDAGLSDKIVITHGTDVMAATAFLLQLTLPPEIYETKKIVLTGSMLPSDPSIANPDGPGNLKDAFRLAKSSRGGTGVYVQMGGKILCPTDTDKRHTSSRSAFKEINQPAVGKVRGSKVTIANPMAKRPLNFDISGVTKLPYIEVIYAAPGSDPLRTVDMIKARDQEVDGFVYIGTGGGTIQKDIQDELAKVAASKLVVRAGMAGEGEVFRNGHAEDDSLGFACAGTLPSPIHARVLAQVALAAEIKRSASAGEAVDLARVKGAFDAYQSKEALASKKLFAGTR